MKILQINIREFIKYKFFNSLFLGLSVGSIFVLYSALMPSIYSIGGVMLALAMLFVAKLYSRILTMEYFFKISLLIELVLLFVMLYFLLFSYSYTTALIIYIGYQFTFIFGSYLVRAETLFLKRKKILEWVDVAKQQGYLLGMGLSYLFYTLLEQYYHIDNKETQVYMIHFLLVAIEGLILFYLLQSFKKVNL